MHRVHILSHANYLILRNSLFDKDFWKDHFVYQIDIAFMIDVPFCSINCYHYTTFVSY